MNIPMYKCATLSVFGLGLLISLLTSACDPTTAEEVVEVDSSVDAPLPQSCTDDDECTSLRQCTSSTSYRSFHSGECRGGVCKYDITSYTCQSGFACSIHDVGCQSVEHRFMTNLDPETHGFRFNNGFANYNNAGGIFDIRTPNGLCGGMSYAVLDYFHAGVRIPDQWHRPQEGSALQGYLYARQVDSLVNPGDQWADVCFNPFGSRNGELFRRGLDSEFEKLKSRLLSHGPTVIGMKSEGAGICGGHQVLAIGYEQGRNQGNFNANHDDPHIFVLDPNQPRLIKIVFPDRGTETWRIEGQNKRYRTYFVDTDYRAVAPRIFEYETQYADNGFVYEMIFQFATGEDDLRGGHDNVDVELLLANGTRWTFRDLNRSTRWLSNNSQWVQIRLPRPVQPDELMSATFTDTFGGGVSGDNWDIDRIDAHIVQGSPNGNTYARKAYSTSKRLTGQHDPFTLSLADPYGMVRQLYLTVMTGNDDLRGGDDNVGLFVNRLDGYASEQFYTINEGRQWKKWTQKSVLVDLQRPIRLQDISTLTLRITSRGGFGADDWHMRLVTIDARGPGVNHRIAQSGAKRFSGSSSTLSIRPLP